MRERLHVGLQLGIILVQLSGSYCDRQELTNYIKGLNYNPDVVLASKGESITSFRKKEGNLDRSNNFIVVTRQRKSISNGQADIGVIASNEHRVYPGALLLANSRLIDNNPDPVPINRAPLRYTTNLPGLTSEGTFTIVPSNSNYQSAINGLLQTWYTKHPDDQNVNSRFQSDHSLVYSKEQLRAKFGVGFNGIVVESNIDFEAVNRQEQLVMVMRFKQVFYTVSVDTPNQPGDLFDAGVTKNQLSSKVNNDNPPVLVDSVSYGRVIYVKIQTTSTDNEAKSILLNKFTKYNIENNNEVEWSQRLENFNMQVFVMGGGSEQIDLINARTMKDVNDVIVKHGKFSRTNLGYPVSYSCHFIKDNTRAVVQSTSDYTETSREEFQHGVLKFVHTGGYVAQWHVEWDEVSYDQDGNERVGRKKWDKSDQDLTAKFTGEIQLGGNCRNIAVKAKEATGLAWEWWRQVIDRSGIPLIGERTFSIWGTTLDPKYSIEPPV